MSDRSEKSTRTGRFGLSFFCAIAKAIRDYQNQDWNRLPSISSRFQSSGFSQIRVSPVAPKSPVCISLRPLTMRLLIFLLAGDDAVAREIFGHVPRMK